MVLSIKITRSLVLILIFFGLGACSQPGIDIRQHPEAIEGVLDLRNWDFEKEGSITLAGEWAFYWEELLQPEEIINPNQASYVPVPDIWTNYDIEGKNITPDGYATYYLRIYPPDAHQTFGLYIEGQGSAYKLWIDGRLVSQNGQIGTSIQTMRPEKKPYTIFFQSDREAVELVMQISNFHHRKGGFRNNLSLGVAETMHQTQMQNWFVEAFAVGVLFIMGLYHFFLYTFRKKNKAPLYFALITWLMTIRVGITNQNTLLFHLPALSWDLALRIEYLTFFLGPYIFTLFIQSLYPKDIHRWFIRVMFWLGCGFSLFILFTDTLRLSYIPPDLPPKT
ncbi:MAG: 7TM-DISM domain-containing protein, partial [Chloroflexi bacterium]|nr:7TM-DISM domain-containing protein [Chloroflexota bacterium]